MDIQVTNKVIGTTESLFDDFDERPVDCDFVLPDYLPDIAAVLKCTMKPVVQSKQLSGDRLIADGVANLRVLYLDEARKCVRSCEFTQPFTSTFNVKNAGVGACIRLDAKPNYVNCRATSPRRLDIHGAFSVKLKVTAEGGQEVVSSARGEGVYTRTKPLYYTVPASSAEKPFTISEVLELGSGKLPAETLIRSEAVANVQDCKMMPGKVILKGEVLLCTLYANDTVAGTMDRVEHEIPFSQIVDVDGLDEEWFCDCRADVTVCDVHITQNPNGENVLLSVSIKLQAQVQCYHDRARRHPETVRQDQERDGRGGGHRLRHRHAVPGGDDPGGTRDHQTERPLRHPPAGGGAFDPYAQGKHPNRGVPHRGLGEAVRRTGQLSAAGIRGEPLQNLGIQHLRHILVRAGQ